MSGDGEPAMAFLVAEETTAASSGTVPRVGPTDCGGGGVTVEAVMEKHALAAGEGHETMVGVHLAAPSCAEESRAPVDCVVVSDVSGSMQGSKLALLRETSKLLLKELSKQDRVGLVTFDSRVAEPLRLSANVHMDVPGRETAEALVDKFRAGSATNLSGGLFAGVAQFSAAAAGSDSRVKTLLLLTDGMANHGIQHQSQLVPILNGMLRDCPDLSVHTFGYGSDHQSELLRAISETGSGSYYFVQNNEDIRAAFGDCLGGVLSVVAQNLVLEVEAVGDALIRKVHHPSAECLAEGRRYTVRFADLYGDEERDVLVSMHLPPCSTGSSGAVGSAMEASAMGPAQCSQAVLRCTLKYVDVVGARTAQARATAEVYRPAQVSAPVTPDPRIALHRARIQVATTLDDARARAEHGDLSAARSMLASMKGEVEAVDASAMSALGSGAVDMLAAFKQDLVECQADLVDQRAYMSRGRHKMSSYAQGHTMQRCAESAAAPAVQFMTPMPMGSFASPGGPPQVPQHQQQRFNAYRTGAKKAKASAFMGFGASSYK